MWDLLKPVSLLKQELFAKTVKSSLFLTITALSSFINAQNKIFYSEQEILLRTRYCTQNKIFYSEQDIILKTMFSTHNKVFYSEQDILLRTRYSTQNKVFYSYDSAVESISSHNQEVNQRQNFENKLHHGIVIVQLTFWLYLNILFSDLFKFSIIDYRNRHDEFKNKKTY